MMAVAVIATLAYPVYFEGAAAGQTPGMKLMGLRVLRERDLRPLGFRLATGRLLAIVTNAFGIGLLVALGDARRRTLRDQAAGTIVVKVAAYPVDDWPGPGSWTGEDFRPAAVLPDSIRHARAAAGRAT